MARIADQKQDFPQWYLDVIAQADLAEHADVKGCIIFKPYGYAIWEAIQRDLDARIKKLNVQNCYFPLFIPESLIAKEKDHIDGFAPECAVVTHGGGKELTEKLYVRPTSETVIYSTFAKWIQSYRDLPLNVNQWCNVVRWEMRTRPFLRTLEFLWQEGHTAHATREEAEKMVKDALQMYVDFDRDCLALPVMQGRKPDHEVFAGAVYTLSTEALAKDGKAIQAGTSHYIGDSFSAAYGVQFLDSDGVRKPPHTTSWGLSTRIIGTMIVVHGDEKGLRLPPNVAPIQVVVIPIYKTDDEKNAVLAACKKLMDAMPGLRVKLDDRDDKSPGFKFNEWEVKGVPVRIEIGPKDLEKKQLTIARRDTGKKKPMPLDGCDETTLHGLLDDVQRTMYEQAEAFLKSHTYEMDDDAKLAEILDGEGGMVWMPWDGTMKSADALKEKHKATIRLVDDDAAFIKGKKDPFTGAAATTKALVARAY